MTKKHTLVLQDLRKHYVSDRLVSPDQPIKVLVVGAGGTGSRCLSWLAQMDYCLRKIGHKGFEATVMDDDTISESNVGRQMFSISDIGLNKATVFTTRVNNFFGLKWRGLPVRLTEHTIRRYDLHYGIDLIITAVDNVASRELVFNTFRQSHASASGPVYWIDTGCGRDSGQVVMGTLGPVHQPQGMGGVNELPTVLDLYPDLASMETDLDQGPSCSVREALERQGLFTNPFVADAAMSLLLDAITKGVLTGHGSYITMHPDEVTPLLIDLEMWKRMGVGSKVSKKAKAV